MNQAVTARLSIKKIAGPKDVHKIGKDDFNRVVHPPTAKRLHVRPVEFTGEDARGLTFTDDLAGLIFELVAVPAFTPIQSSVRPKERAMNVSRVAGVAEIADQFGAFVRNAIAVRVDQFPKRAGRAGINRAVVRQHALGERQLVRKDGGLVELAVTIGIFEHADEVGQFLGERGHEFGTITGRKRRCGWFDAVLVKQAVATNGITGIALTKLDVLDGLKEIKICTGYMLDGELIDYLPASQGRQARVEPVYETLEGWEGTTVGARTWNELPAQAVKYVRHVEELIGAPVALLSTSPERDDTILVHDPFQD